MTGEDGFALGLLLGLALGIVIDRAVIPFGERLGDRLALVRHRRRPRGR